MVDEGSTDRSERDRGKKELRRYSKLLQAALTGFGCHRAATGEDVSIVDFFSGDSKETLARASARKSWHPSLSL